MPTAYSYRRFSSKKQEEGDSLRRQTEAAEKFLTNHPEYILSKDTYVDKGVSAYKGKNKDEGELAQFIEAVESGKIEKGSLLLIESVDRLSRLLPSKAKELFNRILDKGIKIAIIRFGVIFDKQTVDFDLGSDLLLTCSIHLAHQESLQKSERIRSSIHDNQIKAEQGGEKRTALAPFWLELSEDRSEFTLKNQEAEAVQELFKRKQSGDTMRLLIEYMNATGLTPPRSKSWSVNSVRRILKHPACIGTLSSKSTVKTDDKQDVVTVKDIPNYYPSVVSEELFYSVNKMISNTSQGKSKGGRKGNYLNLFRSMVFCGCCGNSMQSKTGWKAGKTYLRCLSQLDKSGSCTAKNSVRYWELEPVLLKSFSVLDYGKFETGDNLELQRQKDAIEGKIATLNEQKQRLINLVKDVGGDSDISDQITQLKKDVESLTEKGKAIAVEAKINASPVTYAEYQQQLEDLDISSPEQRERFNSFLQKFINRIEFFEEYMLIHLRGYEFPLVHLFYESYNPAAFDILLFLHEASEGKEQEEHTQNLVKMMLDASAQAPDSRFEDAGTFVEGDSDSYPDFKNGDVLMAPLTLKEGESGEGTWGKYKNS